MITTTALDIIKLASKLSGALAIGQQLQAEDAFDALNLLNSMLRAWEQDRWAIWRLKDVSCVSTNAQSYSVGPGGDINTARPDRLQAAYVRLLVQNEPATSGLVDFQLTLLETYEEYSAIALKKLQSFPSLAFYDPTFPLGTLYVWPIPSTDFEIHLVMRDRFEQFDSLTSQFAMPPEYYEAILYNLAGRLMLMFQLPMNPAVIALAKAALNNVRVANHRVANLNLPAGLMRHGGWPVHGVPGVVEGTFTLDESVLG